MNAAEASLFDAPEEPVTGNAGDWLGGLLGGELTTALCVVAIAMLGLLMLGGRLPVRTGLKVVMGCFLLLSASLVATGLQGVERDSGVALAQTQNRPVTVETEPEVLPPANYDPYAGASLRTR